MGNSKKGNGRINFNILSMCIYIIGIILLIQLFNLQIIHGKEYREQSNTRLSRESELQAARGNILDSSGNILATSKMGFSLELYKTKISDEALNKSILELTKVLEEHGQSYVDSFPINPDPYEFTIEGEELSKWKEKNKLKEEVEELCKDRNAEEMADVIEVLTCLCIDDPTTYGNVFEIAKVKKEKRGSFLRRYFLKKYE